MTVWWNDVGDTQTLDEDSVDAVLRGDHVSPEMEPLADFVQMIRTAAIQPVEPVGELADRLVTGEFISYRARHRARDAQTKTKLVATSLRTKVAGGIALTLTGLAAATAAGALPAGVADRIESVIEFITPIEFAPDSDDGDLTRNGADDTADQRISHDAPEPGRHPAEQALPAEIADQQVADLAPALPIPAEQLTSPGLPADDPSQPPNPGQQTDDPGQPANQGEGSADPGQQPTDRGQRPDDPGRKPADPGQQGTEHGLQRGRDHSAPETPGRAATGAPTSEHVRQGPPDGKPMPNEHAKVKSTGKAQELRNDGP
jgi:hypothetical protein